MTTKWSSESFCWIYQAPSKHHNATAYRQCSTWTSILYGSIVIYIYVYTSIYTYIIIYFIYSQKTTLPKLHALGLHYYSFFACWILIGLMFQPTAFFGSIFRWISNPPIVLNGRFKWNSLKLLERNPANMRDMRLHADPTDAKPSLGEEIGYRMHQARMWCLKGWDWNAKATHECWERRHARSKKLSWNELPKGSHCSDGVVETTTNQNRYKKENIL
jgi:hypothetical protein